MNAMNFCPKCGAPLELKDKFCGRCGYCREAMSAQSSDSVTPSLVHQKSSKNKTAVLVTIAVLMVLVSVILAYVVDLNTSTIYDGHEIAPFSGLHFDVITGLWVVACLLLLPVSKGYASNAILKKHRLGFHGCFVLSGLFFAGATENGARVRAIEGFDSNMEQAPSWYGEDVVNQAWYAELPDVVDQLSGSMTVKYVLMAFSLLITLYFAVRLFGKQERE